MLQPYNMSSNWVKGILDFSKIPLLKEKKKQYITKRWGDIDQCVKIFKFLQHFEKESFRSFLETRERKKEIYKESCGLRTPVYSIACHLLFISKYLKHLLPLLRGEMSSVLVWLRGEGVWRIPASKENKPGLESWNHLVLTSGVGN